MRSDIETEESFQRFKNQYCLNRILILLRSIHIEYELTISDCVGRLFDLVCRETKKSFRQNENVLIL